jgi:hypothetical protein
MALVASRLPTRRSAIPDASFVAAWIARVAVAFATAIVGVAAVGAVAVLWVPKTRPGILSRRFARRDRIRPESSDRHEVTRARTNEHIATAANTAKRLDPSVASSIALATKRARERRTIRVDRAVPKSDHTMAATWTKPQVSGPDEFSAPTGVARHRLRITSQAADYHAPHGCATIGPDPKVSREAMVVSSLAASRLRLGAVLDWSRWVSNNEFAPSSSLNDLLRRRSV